jgi:hypothetical protein
MKIVKNNKQQIILFISVDPFVNDLEWKLPLILEYAKLNYTVHVFLLYRFKKAGRNFFVWILEKHNIKIFYQEDLSSFEPIPQRLYQLLINSSKKSLLTRLLSKLYFSDTHFLTKILLIKSYRKYFMRKRINQALNNYRYTYLCQFPNMHIPLVLSLFQSLGPKSSGKFIGLPDAAHVFWVQDSIQKYDLMLLNTHTESEGFKRISKIPFMVSGSLHFNFQWQQSIIHDYENYNGNVHEIPRDKENILILLVKPGHVYWESISHDRVVGDLLQSVSSNNTHLLIKPHPRANIDELGHFLASLRLDSYQIVLDNVGFWAEKSDKVISLLSYSCLSALAVRKVPYVYWPIAGEYKKYLDEGGNDILIKLFLTVDENGKYSSIFHEYCIDVFAESFRYPKIEGKMFDKKLEKFKTDFRIENSLPGLIEEIHDT